MTRFLFLLLLLLGATGLFLFAGTIQTPLYFPILDGHRYAGWALLALALPGLALHLRNTESKGRSSVLALGLVLLAFAPALAPFDKEATDPITKVLVEGLPARDRAASLSSLGRYGTCLTAFMPGAVTKGDPLCHRAGGSLALTLLLAVPGLLAATALLLRPEKGRPARLTGLALLILTTWALATGALISLPIREHWLFGGSTLHSAAGIGTAALLGVHVVLRAGELWRLGARLIVGPSVGAILLGLAAAWVGLYQREHFLSYYPATVSQVQATWDIPATAESRRAFVRGESGPSVPQRWLPPAEDCRGSGCHDRLVDQWELSAHRYAADNAFYRAAVAGIVHDRGVAEAAFCAACHDPKRLLAGEVAQAYANGQPPLGSEGVGCVTCHAINAASANGHANGRFRYAFAEPYPESAGPRAIRLDPRAHRAAHVHPRTLIGEAGCVGCHRVELGPDIGAPSRHVVQSATRPETALRQQAFCTSCHLPFDEDGRYGHLMAGGSVDLARYAHPSDAEAADRLRGRDAAIQAFSGFQPVRPFTGKGLDEDRRRPIKLSGTGRIEATPEGGSHLALNWTTAATGLGHPFPIGPFDLHECWFELRITDANGLLVWHVGEGRPDGPVPDSPLRLGALELDANSQPIREHRIWTVSEVRPFGSVDGGRRDTTSVPLPPGFTAPFLVEGRWVLRRAPPEFVRFALGEEAEAFPLWTVADTSFRVRAGS